MSHDVVVIVPVYKSLPDDMEKISFRQNVKVLASHPFSIATHSQLDISYYIDILESENVFFQINFFDKKCFESLNTYNKLLLSESFYKEYSDFTYLLITQLDVYIFRDELYDWIKKGYDYIGAPWFNRFRNNHLHAKLSKVGNGGFSLRKCQTFIDSIEYAQNNNKKISITNFWNIYEFFECHKFSWANVLKRLKGAENNLQYYMNSDIQEDVIWSLIVPEAISSFKVAPVKEALRFSFESDPSYLYEINNQKLPFGCHAWYKNQYNEFWSKFIK